MNKIKYWEKYAQNKKLISKMFCTCLNISKKKVIDIRNCLLIMMKTKNYWTIF